VPAADRRAAWQCQAAGGPSGALRLNGGARPRLLAQLAFLVAQSCGVLEPLFLDGLEVGSIQLRWANPPGERLKVHGQLDAAGKAIPLELDATMRHLDGELEIEAVTEADHRRLGMTWSPLGILRTPSKLIVRGRLIPQTDDDR
jgi:hypothetical protein